MALIKQKDFDDIESGNIPVKNPHLRWGQYLYIYISELDYIDKNVLREVDYNHNLFEIRDRLACLDILRLYIIKDV